MNDQKKQIKKLSLNKETLRNISQLGQEKMKAPLTSPRCSEFNCESDLCA